MRHGDVRYIAEDGSRIDHETVPLTERGREQAQAAGQLLAEVPFDLTITSGLLRTEQTADIVCADRDVPRRVVSGLQEIRPGTFEEIDTEDEMRRTIIDGFWDAERAGDEGRFLTGDRYSEFHARIQGGLRAVLEDDGWSELLMVLHGGVNRAILCDALGAGRRGWGAIEQDACCVNVIDLLPGGPERPTPEDPYGGRLPGTHARAVVRLINHTPYAPDKRTTRRTTLEALWTRFSGEP